MAIYFNGKGVGTKFKLPTSFHGHEGKIISFPYQDRNYSATMDHLIKTFLLNGNEYTKWINWMQQFFKFNQIFKIQKVLLASYHLEKKALHVSRNLKNIMKLYLKQSWLMLFVSISIQLYIRYIRELIKLYQDLSQSVQDSQARFEMLVNCIARLTKEFFH